MDSTDQIRIDFIAEKGELFLVLYGFDPKMGGPISFRRPIAARTFEEFQENNKADVIALLEGVEEGDGKVRVGQADTEVLRDSGNIIDALRDDFDTALLVLEGQKE